jgi:pseudoazurin
MRGDQTYTGIGEMIDRAADTMRALTGAGLVMLLVACSDESPPATGTISAREPTPPAAVTMPADVGPVPVEAEAEPPPPVAVEVPATATASGMPDTEDAGDAGVAGEPRQHEVKGVVTQWGPLVTFAAPGDTIVFRQMTGHDTETIEGMIPAGAQGWKSSLCEEGFSVTLSVPGAYVFKCNPHVSMGMVGAVIVGGTPPANLADIEASPQNKGMIGRAIRKLKEALEAG